MEGAPTTKEARRRLPSWMLPPLSKDLAAKGARSKVQDTRPQPLAAVTTKQAVVSKKETSKHNGHINVERKKRERKRMTFQDEEASNNMLHNIGSDSISFGETGEKVRETAPWKRRRAKGPLPEGNQESENTSPSSDDVELTVDDMMRIAAEYVKSKKESDMQQPSLAKCKSAGQPLRGSLMDVQGGSLASDTSDPKILGNEKSTDECSTTNSNTEKNVVSMKSTGDPAQDMLDLFLGPLLKKPAETDKKDTLVPDDMTMMQVINKSNQNSVVGDSLPPLKKKSSLKEKVAMFFE